MVKIKQRSPKKGKKLSKKPQENILLSLLQGFKLKSFKPDHFLKSKNLIIFVGVLITAGLLYLIFNWLVVAWVDQTPITRIQLLSQLESKFGANLKDQLVSETLIENEAKRRGISVSNENVDEEFKKTEEQVGGKDVLLSLLSQEGADETEFRRRLRLQLLIKKMFESDVNVSDEEVSKYIEENKNNLLTTNPQTGTQSAIDDKLKASVKEQLTNQKINEVFRTWLEDAKKSSRVKNS